MYFLLGLFIFCMCITVPLFFLELCLFAYRAFMKIEIPQGTKDPIKLRLYHLGCIWSFNLGKICERMGICTQIQCVRFVINFVPSPGKDSKLIIRDSNFEHVPVRIYQHQRPSSGLRRGLLYLHGGCAMFGGKRTYERVCRYLARESDSVVVFVDYRLAPEHQHPTQISECLNATIYFMENANSYGVDVHSIVLIGESSGGALVSAVCRELVKKRHVPKIEAQILVYPFLQFLNLSLPSHQQNRFGPGLTLKRCLTLGFQYMNEEPSNFEDLLNNAHVPENKKVAYKKWFSADCIPEIFKARGYEPPLYLPFSKELCKKLKMEDKTLQSPIEDEDAIIQQLPKTYILTCEYDVIRDDGLLYKKRLEENGVPVTWTHLPDGFHGCALFIDTWKAEFSCTRPAFEDIVHFIKGL